LAELTVAKLNDQLLLVPAVCKLESNHRTAYATWRGQRGQRLYTTDLSSKAKETMLRAAKLADFTLLDKGIQPTAPISAD
jgi:hypothetical protein